jgi:hypothetical protein
MRRLVLLALLGIALLVLGFGGGAYWQRNFAPTPTATVTPTPTRTLTPTASATFTATPSATASPTSTLKPSPSPTDTPAYTPTQTETPTITLTPSKTPTPTSTPEVRGVVLQQSNCRYGPGSAYLYEWGLYPTNRVTVLGRNQEGTWVYVDPWNYTDKCWVKTDLLELSGDVSTVPQIRTLLPYTQFYWPPPNVRSSRLGDEILVNWDLVPMSLDDNRGYLIEAWLCQDRQLRFIPTQYWTPPAILIDEAGCMEQSSARIYTAEKHGYTEWIAIVIPPHPTPTATSKPPLDVN